MVKSARRLHGIFHPMSQFGLLRASKVPVVLAGGQFQVICQLTMYLQKKSSTRGMQCAP